MQTRVVAYGYMTWGQTQASCIGSTVLHQTRKVPRFNFLVGQTEH